MARRRVTLSELGRLLDLDKSSVSLALRNSPKVSDATRQRVQEVARRYGYQPNLAARQLNRRSRPQIVTLVLPHSLSTLNHAQPVATIRTLSQTGVAKGFVFNILSSRDIRAALEGSSDYPLLPDGVFLWGDVTADTPRLLDGWGIPYVVLDPNHVSYVGFTGPTVEIDNRGGAKALVEHIVERGAQRLFFIGSEASHLSHQNRWEAARTTWLSHKPVSTLQFAQLEHVTDDDLAAFARTRDGAIVCYNDRAAMEVWHRLAALDLTVPGDVRLAGFDGDAYGRLVGLTTAIFDAERLAQHGWEVLMAALGARTPDPVHETIPVALSIGATT